MPKLESAVLRVAATIALAASTAVPVHAHPGSHHGLSLAELAAHLSTGWHLALLVAAVVISIAVVALGARAQSRQQRRKS